MKKIQFLSLTALALLGAACSNDETVDMSASSRKAIAFDNAFINNAVRSAEDPSYQTSTLPAFNVWGYIEGETGALFNGDEVNKTINNTENVNNSWSYQNTRYWTAGKKYHFAAVAPTRLKGNVTPTFENNAITASVAFTPSTDAGGTEDDLIYAAKNETTDATLSSDKTVQLTFYHMLSKVKFTFINNDASEAIAFVVKNVKITNGCTAATVTLTNEDASVAANVEVDGSDAKNISYDFGNVHGDSDTDVKLLTTNTAGWECANERILIPYDNSGADAGWSVSFEVEVWQGSEPDKMIKTSEFTGKTATVKAKLESKKAYNFKAYLDYGSVVGDEYPIKFDVVNIAEWETGSDFTAEAPYDENHTATN